MSHQIQIRQEQVSAVFGNRGFGKSTLAKSVTKSFSRRIVIDPNWEHDDLGRVIHEAHQVDLNVVFQPYSDSYEELTPILRFAWTKGNLSLMIDECETYASKREIHPILSGIIRRGRHRLIGLVAVTRTTPELHNLIVTQANHLFIFHLDHPDYCKYFEKRCNIPAEQIRALPRFVFIHYDSDANTTATSRLTL